MRGHLLIRLTSITADMAQQSAVSPQYPAMPTSTAGKTATFVSPKRHKVTQTHATLLHYAKFKLNMH